MSKYCTCGKPNEALANFCARCGRSFGKVSEHITTNAPSQIKSPITRTTISPKNDFSQEEKDYINQYYKTVAPLNIAKKLKPKDNVGVSHPFVKQISEYTKLLKRADPGGGDVVVGREESDDEDDGSTSLNEMPDINLEGLQIESFSSTQPEVLSFATVMEEARKFQAQQGQKPS